jgi:chromosome segregation ATPase
LEELKNETAKLSQTQSNLQDKHEDLLKSHSSATLLFQKAKNQTDEIAKKKAEADSQLQKVNTKRAAMLKKHTSTLDEESSTFAKYQEDLKLAKEKRAMLEKQVKEAEKSLQHLDAALRKSGVKIDIDVTADVKNLTSFFEETVDNMKKEKEEFQFNF